MVVFFVSVIVLLAFLSSAYGWGRLVFRPIYGGRVNGWSYFVTLGIAVWIFIGGTLNVAKLANPVAICTIFSLGFGWLLLLALSSLWKARFTISSSIFVHMVRPASLFRTALRSLPLLMILIAVSFLVATLMPTSAFNFDDDFYTYFVRPLKMLQTGTLGDMPFDGIGVDSLGGSAFLQSFVLVRFPIQYLNGFDTIFCFMLCAFLLSEIARREECPSWYLAVSLLTFAVINPQIVNISAVYSASMLMLAIVIASYLLIEVYDAPDIRIPLVRTIPLGLLLFSLVSLKVTFVFFAASYFAFYFGLATLLSAQRKRMAVLTAFSGLVVALCAVPWLVLHSSKYASVLDHLLSGTITSPGTVAGSAMNSVDLMAILSTDELVWGGSYLDYNVLVTVMGVAFLLSVYLLYKWSPATQANNGCVREKQALITILSSCGAGIVSYLSSLYFINPISVVRYGCPVFIAVLPVTALLLGRCCFPSAATQKTRQETSRISYLAIFAVVCQGIVAALFGDVMIERIQRARNQRTPLAFPIKEAYIQHNAAVLRGRAREQMRSLQDKTRKGDTILAWISLPFHLDFIRNRVLIVNAVGLQSPSVNLPIRASRQTMLDHLRGLGVRYVIWQYDGLGMQSELDMRTRLLSPFSVFRRYGQNGLYFKNAFRSLANKDTIIHRHGNIVVLDLHRAVDETSASRGR